MSEKRMEERDLKEYIVKLNDRNIQRQRESGLTLYAIIAVIVYCVFYLIDNLKILFDIFNEPNSLIVTVFTANAITVFLILYYSYDLTNSTKRRTKIFPNKQPSETNFSLFPPIIAQISISCLNFGLLESNHTTLSVSFLWIFGSFSASNILSIIIIALSNRIKRCQKRKKGLSTEQISYTFFNDKNLRSLFYIVLTIALSLIIYWLIVLMNTKIGMRAEDISKIVKYVITYFALLLILNKVFEIKRNENNNKYLEDFEKEIYFDNITNEEIAKRFENEFHGIPFSRWIVDKNIEIMNFFNEKRQAFLAQELLLKVLDTTIDKTKFQFEYAGRLNEINTALLEISHATNKFFQENSSAFSDLKIFASLNNEDVTRLINVMEFYNSDIRAFKMQYENMLQLIAAKQKK